jgi:hypothetical protein
MAKMRFPETPSTNAVIIIQLRDFLFSDGAVPICAENFVTALASGASRCNSLFAG